jgi:hypothetical protein
MRDCSWLLQYKVNKDTKSDSSRGKYRVNGCFN